jgi:2,3,4,5-tetrahydropyridine-2,6-dicarboxylate N-succinyltransferase
MQDLQKTIEDAFERRADITPRNADAKLKDAVMSVIDMLDKGQLRVAERTDGQNWTTHQWIKKAVLLFAWKTMPSSGRSQLFLQGALSSPTSTRRTSAKAPVVPLATARGSYIGRTWC